MKRSIGYVYFVQVMPDGPIKIGRANEPRHRLVSLRVSMPFDLRTLLLIRGADNEKALHRRFSYLLMRGEWFRPHSDLIEFIGDLSSRAVDSYSIDGEAIPVAEPPKFPRMGRWDFYSEEHRRVEMAAADRICEELEPVLAELMQQRRKI